jgi:aldose sugar dehydrogenase
VIRLVVVAIATLAVISLSTAGRSAQRLRTEKAKIVVETVARDLDHPWGMAFLPDGRMLVTEHPGRLHIVSYQSALIITDTPIGAVRWT